MQAYKVDLHTHSIVSPDGGLRFVDYQQILMKGVIDVIAITDHNRIDFALMCQKKLGNAIIVGEEIMTIQGEMIGIYLSEHINPGLSARETALRIHQQKGLVFIPHPFETTRSGIAEKTLTQIGEDIDGIEIFNARSLQPRTRTVAKTFVQKFSLAPACSSDSHCPMGIGCAYSCVSSFPERKNLVSLLKQATTRQHRAPLLSFLCPKVNRMRHRFFH